ncbi:MAG: TAXI family TRAP transporter solute-binding subunit [Pseudomonadota bacterium]
MSLFRLPLAFALALGLSAGSAVAQERALVIGTGPAAGNYFPVGGALCRVLNQGRADDGARCLVEATSGSAENLRRLGQGDFDLAIVQSDWQFHAPSSLETVEQGSAEADGQAVRAVLSLQAQPLTLIAGPESGIDGLADLAGKRVSLAPEGSSLRAATLSLLEAMGWQASDLEIAATPAGPEMIEALCRGQIDAALLPLSHPSGLVKAAAERCNARLIPLEPAVIELVERAWPFYGRADIPGGLYAGHPEATPTIGLRATLVASAALSDDVVYRLVARLFGQLEALRAQHPLLAHLAPGEMVAKGNTISFHDGAIRYYEEQDLPLPTQNSE